VMVAGHDGGGAGDDPEGDRADAVRADRRDAELDRLAGLTAGGDRAALDQLLALIGTPVTRYCRARMGGSIGLQSPEDVAQDVLLAVCDALHRFRPGEKAVMAFVYGIARNKVVDTFRAAGRDRSDPTDAVPETTDSGAGPEDQAVLGAEVGVLRELLEQLPQTHREVLVLRIAMQFSAEETARTVGSTAGAVRVAQHRALAKLRALVAERWAEESP
jgi:RNA polymerase sigma-70 factor, ECF subfamily